MASMQARLHELSVKCDKFQAKYANLCEPDTVETIHVILRQAAHMLVMAPHILALVTLSHWMHAGLLWYAMHSKWHQTLW